MVVMSGRGGCGKTFVVSKVLSKALDIKRKKVIQDFAVGLDGANFTTSDADNEVATSPDLNVQTTHESNHKSDREGHEVKLDLQCDPAASKTDSIPQGNEKLSSERKAQLRKLKTMLKEIDDEVLLTAPTGKAASILGKRTRLPSHTLHSVIYSHQRWEMSGQDEWKFSKVRLLVCDECSLISVRVFSKLIAILNRSSQLQQIILLGDINQLPSIEPGNFLNDVYYELMLHGVSIA